MSVRYERLVYGYGEKKKNMFAAQCTFRSDGTWLGLVMHVCVRERVQILPLSCVVFLVFGMQTVYSE